MAAPTGTSPVIALRHGDDHTILLNSNSRVDILLHHVRSTLRYPYHTIDLFPFDTSKGEAKSVAPLGLCEVDPATGLLVHAKTYAKDVPGCTDRGRFALIGIVEDEDSRQYVPLLTGGEDADKLRALLAALPTAKGGAAGAKGKKK
eukprot:TRINITY_DN44590_c0_g1_i1.p2 TRINITY_DN44590_c0_g1~~TRINITY_DN44590_c0_g1_i1.p2  ORF type:complete len:162 (+),score=46.69 TRINITY_DN44590_c0_g1_i1:51-488(+)